MKDLQVNRLKEYLNKNGFNIQTLLTFEKGQSILFKKVPEDTIVLTHHFDIGCAGWQSGVQLKFYVIDDKLIFQGRGVFGFRDDSYDTPVNNNILNNLIKMVESYSIG